MRYLAIIPARYASTRFPGKPLADLLGKPMIQRVYDKVNHVFPYCYVATDDERIATVVRGFGGKVVMTSTEHRSGTDRCREALDLIEKELDTTFEVVVNIQGDEPFVSVEQMDMIRTCFGNQLTDIATLVKVFSPEEDIFNPNSPKVVCSPDGYALYFSRAVIPYIRGAEESQWWLRHKFYKHIGLYAYRTEVLREISELPMGELEKCESLEQLRWLENGYAIKVAETRSESLAIDTPDNLAEAVAYMKTLPFFVK